jgi:hypothetical protein
MPYCRGLYFSVPVLSRTGRGIKVENLGYCRPSASMSGSIDCYRSPVRRDSGFSIRTPNLNPARCVPRLSAPSQATKA